jgi:DNA-binding FrmR family transcriptional regulator
MIKVGKGALEISGTTIDILAELTSVMHELVVNMEVISKDDLDMCVKPAVKSDEEVNKEANECLQKLLSLFD